MQTKSPTELQDLIDRPGERESIELKSWIDLADKSSSARAAIARHIAAISNIGGGYLLFGFNNDGTRCGAIDRVREKYSHDVIAGIVGRYLHPRFQCDVYFETRDGVEHAIVWIPPHGTVPVISKADGPQGEDGQPQGIRAGIVYIRSPKPESTAATTPDQWRELIQRCVLARRDELVRMFSEIVNSGSIPGNQERRDQTRDKLQEFHEVTQRAFLLAITVGGAKPKFPVQKNFMQFSYAIRTSDNKQISPDRLLSAIERASSAVRDTVRYGWSMFYPFTRPGIDMHFATDDALDSGQTEFVEVNLVEKGETDHLDFWRITSDGRASIARNYHEDRFTKWPSDLDETQRWFDPWLHVRELTEIVRHARAMSEEFSDVVEICIRAEWRGLLRRVTATSDWARDVSAHETSVDGRVVTMCFPQSELIGNLPGVVSKLFGPVYRLFDPRFDPKPEWVSRIMKQFVVPGL